MAGCGTNKWSPEWIDNILIHAFVDGDYIDYINSWFDEDTANALLEGISLNPLDPSSGLKSPEDVATFLISLSSKPDPVMEVDEGEQPKYESEDDLEDLSTFADFVTRSGYGRIEYDQCVNEFEDEIFNRAILKNGKLLNPNSVNENLLNYKKELLSHLRQFTHGSNEVPDFKDDISFVKFIRATLSAFDQKTKNLEPEAYKDYLFDFVKLAHFDTLLVDFAGFIKKKKAYVNSIGLEMYESMSPFDYKDKYQTYREDAGTEDYSSDFVKLLLRHLKKEDGTPIGFDGFTAVSGKVLEWVENYGNAAVQSALYGGIDRMLTTETERLSGETTSDGEPMFTQYGLEYLLNEFINSVQSRSTLKTEAKAIKDVIFGSKSNLDKSIKRILANQFITSVRYSYIAYRMRTDGSSAELRFTDELLQSELVNKQIYNIQNVIKNRVLTLRSNPEQFARLLEKYDIRINSADGTISINNNGNYPNYLKASWKPIHADKPFKIQVTLDTLRNTYKFAGVESNVPSAFIDESFIKNFIQDVTGLTLPSDYKNVWDASNPSSIGNTVANMWDAFSQLAWITLSASKYTPNGDNMMNDFQAYKFRFSGQELQLYNYYNLFVPIGNFYSVAYGAEAATVLKNAEGNNLPTSQLRTSIFDVKQEIWQSINNKFKTPSNIKVQNPETGVWESMPVGKDAASNNILVKNPNAIGLICTRADMKVGDKSKASQDLTPQEVMQAAIVNDFYFHLNGMHNRLRRASNPTKENLMEDSILIQPITYSDKRTHFLIEINLKAIKLGKQTLKDVLTTISGFGNKTDAIAQVESELRNSRADRVKTTAINLIRRYSIGLGLNIDISNDASYATIKSNLDTINSIISNLSESDLISRFKTESGGMKADIYHELDYVKTKSGLMINPTMMNQLETYASDDYAKFRNRIDVQKFRFVRDLIVAGFEFDPSSNPSLQAHFKSLQEAHPSWFDPIDGTMKLWKLYDNDGKEIEVGWYDANNISINDFSKIEYNPILESYYYADILLSNAFNDMIFGDVSGYKAKHSLPVTDPLFLAEDESSRLTDMAKRTVSGGASRITFAQGMKYGVPPTMKVAAIKDMKSHVFNVVSTSDDTDSQDGSAHTSPIFARLQNYSLLDRRTGNEKKKTFANWRDSETGMAGELKFAEYTTTNEFRRKSSPYSPYCAETMFRLMHSINDAKISKINLSRYYNLDSQQTNDEGDIITFSKPLYRYNVNTLQYEQLLSVSTDRLGYTIATWMPVNEGNTPIGEPYPTDRIRIDNIYKLDQLFGGAYCSEWDNELNKFVWSDANNDIVTTIVCEENLKDDFIALAANHSAIKTGVRNLNPPDVFSMNNTSPLTYMEVSTVHYGIQMNPDHDIEHSSVTEMSQMISSLVQSGLKTGEVNEIYESIGMVALQAIDQLNLAIDRNDQTEIYKIIGEALVRSFSSGSKDVLGLAHAFVAMANKDLENKSYNVRIPYSANTIKASFQATITSFLNKEAIRRKYAGLGGVQTPSFGMIQYHQVGDYKLSWTEFIKECGGYQQALNALSDKSIIVTQEAVEFADGTTSYRTIPSNPYIKLTSRNNLKFGDTILIKNVDDLTWDGDEIKLDRPELLEYYKYKLDRTKEIYVWECKPKDFGGSEIEFTIGGNRFSIWDLDTVRGLAYTRGLLDGTVNLDENLETIKALIRNTFPTIDVDSLDLTDPYIVDDLTKRFKWEVINTTLPLLDRISNGSGEVIPQQIGFAGGTVDSVQLSPIEIAIGKLSAAKLGLTNGDTINDVKRQGAKFFEKKLQHLQYRPSLLSVPSNLYDIVLHNSNGTQTLVMLGGLANNTNRIKQTVSDPDIKLIGGHYWKDDIDYGDASGKMFRLYVGNDGTIYNVIIINDWNDFDELLSTNLYSNHVLNYTPSNWKQLYARQYRHKINNKGYVEPNNISNFVFSGTVDDIKVNSDNLDWVCHALNSAEDRAQKNRIQALARQRLDAFNAQLKIIIDRIPSQSMQSCTSADVVMLLDSDENAVLMSNFLMWVQGSDLDIDKGWMMAYELTDDGKIATLSKLDRYYTPTQVLDLRVPDNRTFTFSQDEGDIEINDPTLSDFDIIKTILNSDSTRVYWNLPDVERMRKIEERINLHQSSRNLPKSTKESGLRNLVVHKINKVLRSPAVQYNMTVPVDEAMADLKHYIPKSAAIEEFGKTWDNPAVKYNLQYENMVGRAVIGIGAVSLKAFYGLTACFNNIISNIEQLIPIAGSTDVNNVIFRHIKDIVFDTKFGASGLATLVNLNLTRLKALTDGLSIRITSDEVDPGQNNLKAYIIPDGDEFMFNLGQLVSDLNEFANGNYQNPKDGAKVLSGIVSLATDNAKTLALAKLNATARYADIYTYLTSIGVPFGDIAEFMTSSTFNLVSRYSQDSILDPTTSRFNVDNAVAFILDQRTLPNINNYVFESILTNISDENKSFIHRLVYGINKNGTLNKAQFKGQNVLDAILRNIATETRVALVQNVEDQVERIISIVNNRKENPGEYSTLIQNLYKLLREDKIAQETLLSTLAYNANTTEDAPNSVPEDDVDYDAEAYYLYNEDMDYIDSEEDAVSDYYRTDSFFEYGELQKKDYVSAYRYVRKYLIPKNNVLNRLVLDPKTMNYESDLQKLQNILQATKEQQILGAIYGINQGMDTGDYEEYAKVTRIEKFINKKYMDAGLTNYEPFNYIEFLSNTITYPDGKTYQQKQIEQYNQVKSTYNVLQMAISVPHYRSMLDTIRTNRYLIERSIALKMERELADQVIKQGKVQDGKFNYGYGQSLDSKAFGITKKYVSDLMILKWLSYQSHLNIYVPEGELYYQTSDWTKPIANRRDPLTGDLSTEFVTLSSVEGCATFKNLMDNYIIPRLKEIFQDNEFIQALQPGSTRNKHMNKLAIQYQLPFNVSEVSKNPALQLKYDAISNGFRTLMNQKLPNELAQQVDPEGTWTIGNLFYIYNLLVGKDGFTAQGMTRLFEDMYNSGNPFSLVNNYYRWLSNLDARRPGFDYRDIFAEELSGTDNSLRNLRWRLSFLDNADYKFKVKEKRDRQGNLLGIAFIGENGEEGPTESIMDINISDFTFDMPFRWSGRFNYQVSDVTKMRAAQDYYLANNSVDYNKTEILKHIVDYLTSKFNGRIPIQLITKAELEDMRKNGYGVTFEDAEDFNRTSNADAFIHNGTIYVNVTNASIDAPIHEMMHLVFAAMKFDDRYKELYYQLVNSIPNSSNPIIQNIWEKTKTKYNLRNGSDIKEEALVEMLSEGFKQQFENNWNGLNQEMKASDIGRITIDILNELLDSSIPEDFDPTTLGNISIRSVLHKFGTNAFSIFNNDFAINRVPLNDRLHEIKDKLIRQTLKDHRITFSDECI